MKILAVDPGSKRIGLAATDSLHLTTRLLPVLKVSNLARCLDKLVSLIAEEDFDQVVIGFPLNMDGSEGAVAKGARKLAESLGNELRRRKVACGVALWDERLTSFEAEQRLRQHGVAKAKAKAFLDSIAAEVLLEDYLSAQPNAKKKSNK